MAKRALLVGLNAYPNPENALRGCLNDVRQMSLLLRDHFGFDGPADVRTLTDRRATTAAIESGLAWLVDGARAGDRLVFHYSGHGSQVPDPHGDERTDGLDEIICPYDLDWDAPFTDDDLHDALKGVPAGTHLTVVLDCCHAGTGLRDLRRTRFLPPPGGHQLPARHGEIRARRFGRKAAEAGAILIAACREEQVSADAFIDGDYHGALTYYLCNTVEGAGYALTYGDLIRRLRRRLRADGFEQDPQLEGPRDAAGRPVFGAAPRALAAAAL
jgi:metacaspase-1